MRAIALVSGGLDSILAAKLVQAQGIEVIPLNFKIPFAHKAREDSQSQACIAAENLKTELRSVSLGDEFLKIISNPRYGFGSNLNPCIDCKILMLKKAKELMQEYDARFVVTGEVLGQRPMSQHKQALSLIERKSGLEGWLLRPLSAKLLPETIPEKEGWVDRSRLLDFSGRTRRQQINLAEYFRLKDYPNAAGGCLLTDPRFAQRLKDLVIHNALTLETIEILRLGRYFRLSPDAFLIVGRNEKENTALEKLARETDFLFYPQEATAGPTALGRGEFSDELIELSCRITCRYCDSNGRNNTDITFVKGKPAAGGSGFSSHREVSPLEEDKLISLRI